MEDSKGEMQHLSMAESFWVRPRSVWKLDAKCGESKGKCVPSTRSSFTPCSWAVVLPSPAFCTAAVKSHLKGKEGVFQLGE